MRYSDLLSSIGAVRMNAIFSASLAVAALAASAIATPVAAQQAKQDFVLVNRRSENKNRIEERVWKKSYVK